MSKESSAICAYVESFKPYVRLDFYDLTDAERKVLRAMLSFTPRSSGLAIYKDIPAIARRANCSERTVQNVIHGYTRKDGTKAIGLMARGILSRTAPANRAKRRPATYRINWEAFSLDPRQIGDLEQRMQLPLPIPGLKTPPIPDDDNRETAGENPVEALRKTSPPGATAAPHMRKGCTPEVQRLHPRGAAAAPRFEILVESLSSERAENSCVVFDRGAVQIQPQSRKRATLSTIHPGLREKILRELREITQAAIGSPRPGPYPEDVANFNARLMRLACERAGIWAHVTEDLVQEFYESTLAKARGEN